MSKVFIDTEHLKKLTKLDDAVREINVRKIRLIFEMVGIKINDADFEKLLGWEIILITVPDKQMAVQLNKLSTYIPNLKFTVDETSTFFSLLQGKRERRVWKERQTSVKKTQRSL